MKENDVFLGSFESVEVKPFGSLAKVILSDMRDPDTGRYLAYISDKTLYIALNDSGEPLMPYMVISNYFIECIV